MTSNPTGGSTETRLTSRADNANGDPRETEPSGEVRHDLRAVESLAALRAKLLSHLRSIDQLCEEILADELCQQLEDAQDVAGEEDFVVTVSYIRQVCDKATLFVREKFDRAVLQASGSLSDEKLSSSVHDFKNLVSGIKYSCELLLEGADQRFLPFEELIEEIRHRFSEAMSAVDEARGRVRRAIKQSRRASVDRSDRQGAESAPPATSPFQVAPPGHVLVVDDEEANRKYLAAELGRHKHRVTLAKDGREALEQLDQQQYAAEGDEIDLVLLDLCMREIDGFEVLQEIKKDYGLRSIPVVVVSAQDDIDTIVQCISAGADDYLTKPFDPQLLAARVTSCLANRQLRKQERILNDQVRAAKERTDSLLYDIFPYTVAEELITSGAVKPRGCDNVAVLFCDVVEFTSYCKDRSPEEIVSNLHELFSAYEDAVRECRVEKIKTIGDCMMVTAGLMRRFENPVLSCLRCAELMIDAAAQCSANWQVRAGIHIGPVVAGMAGNKQYAFDVWGDTVNTAARVQSAADPNTVSVSEPAWARAPTTPAEGDR